MRWCFLPTDDTLTTDPYDPFWVCKRCAAITWVTVMSDAFTDAYHASRNRPGITRHVYGNGTYLLSRTDGWGG